MTVIYALSGIALNHNSDWNPNYIITHDEVQWPEGVSGYNISREDAMNFLDRIDERDNYKSHYNPTPQRLKIFITGGSVELDLNSRSGVMEKIQKRPLFYEINFLHYNPKKLWTWFSDIFCVALIIVCITGLFIIRGEKGITGRGAWLTGLGIIIPVVFLIMYL